MVLTFLSSLPLIYPVYLTFFFFFFQLFEQIDVNLIEDLSALHSVKYGECHQVEAHYIGLSSLLRREHKKIIIKGQEQLMH